MLDAGRGIGLVPVERCVALTAALRGATVTIPAARPAGRPRAPAPRGPRAARTARLDVIVFRCAVAGRSAQRATPGPATVTPLPTRIPATDLSQYARRVGITVRHGRPPLDRTRAQ